MAAASNISNFYFIVRDGPHDRKSKDANSKVITTRPVDDRHLQKEFDDAQTTILRNCITIADLCRNRTVVIVSSYLASEQYTRDHFGIILKNESNQNGYNINIEYDENTDIGESGTDVLKRISPSIPFAIMNNSGEEVQGIHEESDLDVRKRMQTAIKYITEFDQSKIYIFITGGYAMNTFVAEPEIEIYGIPAYATVAIDRFTGKKYFDDHIVVYATGTTPVNKLSNIPLPAPVPARASPIPIAIAPGAAPEFYFIVRDGVHNVAQEEEIGNPSIWIPHPFVAGKPQRSDVPAEHLAEVIDGDRKISENIAFIARTCKNKYVMIVTSLLRSERRTGNYIGEILKNAPYFFNVSYLVQLRIYDDIYGNIGESGHAVLERVPTNMRNHYEIKMMNTDTELLTEVIKNETDDEVYVRAGKSIDELVLSKNRTCIFVTGEQTMKILFRRRGINIDHVPAFATVVVNITNSEMYFDEDIKVSEGAQLIKSFYLIPKPESEPESEPAPAPAPAPAQKQATCTFLMRHGVRNDRSVGESSNPSIVCPDDIAVKYKDIGIINFAESHKFNKHVDIENRYWTLEEEINSLKPFLINSKLPIIIYTSPMIRTIQTGAILYDMIKNIGVKVSPPVIYPMLHERGNKVIEGLWNESGKVGKPSKEFIQHAYLDVSKAFVDDAKTNNIYPRDAPSIIIKYETTPDARERLNEQSEHIRETGQREQKHIFVVGHGDMLGAYVEKMGYEIYEVGEFGFITVVTQPNVSTPTCYYSSGLGIVPPAGQPQSPLSDFVIKYSTRS